MILKDGQKVKIKSINKTGTVYHRILGEDIYEIILDNPIIEDGEDYDIYTTDINDIEIVSLIK